MKNKLSILLVILWLIFIFTMSSFNASASSNQSNFIVNILVNLFNINNVNNLSLIIRKLAHLTEYLILGILVINMFYKNNFSNKYILSIIICILYATSDEIHQLFVQGRSCQITDILIDSFGSLIGIYLYKLLNRLVLKQN